MTFAWLARPIDLNPRTATFNMLGGSLSTHRILMETAGMFTQTDGTVNVANELFVDDNGGRTPSTYYLYGGNLFTSNTYLSSSYPESGHSAKAAASTPSPTPSGSTGTPFTG